MILSCISDLILLQDVIKVTKAKGGLDKLSLDNNFSYLFHFSSPGRSPGRAIVLPPASASASALASAAASALAKCLSFYVKVFYVMGKALSGELFCPCDRSFYAVCSNF